MNLSLKGSFEYGYLTMTRQCDKKCKNKPTLRNNGKIEEYKQLCLSVYLYAVLLTVERKRHEFAHITFSKSYGY